MRVFRSCGIRVARRALAAVGQRDRHVLGERLGELRRLPAFAHGELGGRLRAAPGDRRGLLLESGVFSQSQSRINIANPSRFSIADSSRIIFASTPESLVACTCPSI